MYLSDVEVDRPWQVVGFTATMGGRVPYRSHSWGDSNSQDAISVRSFYVHEGQINITKSNSKDDLRAKNKLETKHVILTNTRDNFNNLFNFL